MNTYMNNLANLIAINQSKNPYSVDNIYNNPTKDYILAELKLRRNDVERCIDYYDRTNNLYEGSDSYEGEINNLKILNNDIDLITSDKGDINSIIEKYRDINKGIESGLSGLQLWSYNPTIVKNGIPAISYI